eukprot:gene20871-26765_t
MPGNSLTDLPRHFSQEELQGLFETVGNARAQEGLPPVALKDIAQAAATSVWAAVVADKDAIGGKYLEDVAIAPVNDAPNPFADGVRSYALDRGTGRSCACGIGAMTTIGIIGAGEVGSHIARAAIAQGYQVVLANSR